MIKLLVTEIAFVDLAALRLLVVKDERSDVAREEAGGCAGKMPRESLRLPEENCVEHSAKNVDQLLVSNYLRQTVPLVPPHKSTVVALASLNSNFLHQTLQRVNSLARIVAVLVVPVGGRNAMAMSAADDHSNRLGTKKHFPVHSYSEEVRHPLQLLELVPLPKPHYCPQRLDSANYVSIQYFLCEADGVSLLSFR